MGTQHGPVFLDDTFAEKLLKKLPGSYGVLTYLVNGMNRLARPRNPWRGRGPHDRPPGR